MPVLGRPALRYHRHAMWPILGVFMLVMSGVSFVVMAWDKRAAVRDRSRIPEATLHLLELLGGWPGSFAAQRLLRHKNRKLSYQLQYWLIVVVFVCAVGGLYWAQRSTGA